MKRYKLYGFMNLFDIIPCFVYPIFQYNNKYYFQEGENDKLIGFVPVKLSAYAMIHKIKDYKYIVGIKDTILSISSKPLYAFQTNKDKIVCGMSDFILSFFEYYQTDNIVLKEEINDFRNELPDAYSLFHILKNREIAASIPNKNDQYGIMFGYMDNLSHVILDIGMEMICCEESREIHGNEMNDIIKEITENLSDLKKEDAENIEAIVDMVKEELERPEPKVERLRNCEILLESILTIVNDMPILSNNLRELISCIIRYI